MRLFAAIDPPADDVETLRGLVGPGDSGLRWVAPDQWHVTLAFYGEVDERRAADLVGRLGRVAQRTAPFTLRLDGAGTFPAQARRARTLWIGVSGDVDDLTLLARRCAAAGRRAGLAIEDRRYRPHLTLARARRDALDLTDRVAELRAWGGGPWPVTSFRLVHSTLGAQVRHATYASWELSTHHA